MITITLDYLNELIKQTSKQVCNHKVIIRLEQERDDISVKLSTPVDEDLSIEALFPIVDINRWNIANCIDLVNNQYVLHPHKIRGVVFDGIVTKIRDNIKEHYRKNVGVRFNGTTAEKAYSNYRDAIRWTPARIDSSIDVVGKLLTYMSNEITNSPDKVISKETYDLTIKFLIKETKGR